MAEQAQYLISGAGIVGLTVARELLARGAGDVLIIEKEPRIGLHASGRNSGVLHAGIYYSPDSLRARSCVRGNMLMKEYCREKGLPLGEFGKVIVTKSEAEVPALDELYRRAVANGSPVEMIDERRLLELEPHAVTHGGRAIYSPLTAVVDPRAILQSLAADIEATGRGRILTSTRLTGAQGSSAVLTDRGPIRFERFINASGAHSDRVARLFGVGQGYRLIPFKGIYKKMREGRADLVRGSIYPVPDARNPFLGVHFTRDVKGAVYAGPTAIPALGRENYGILQGVDGEAPVILAFEALLFATNAKFRAVALAEIPKYRFSRFFADARVLLRDLKPDDLTSSDKAGIRPQLVDLKRRELVMDFLVVRDGPCTHILNAISPAFTASMDFARRVVGEYVIP